MIIRSIGALLNDRPVHSIAPSATLTDACEMLDRYDIGALPVIDDSTLVGILSERDVIRRGNARGLDLSNTAVRDVMTADVEVAFIDDSLADALATMAQGRFRHLPVVDDEGSVIGMLSMRDIPTGYRLMQERYADYMTPDAQPTEHRVAQV